MAAAPETTRQRSALFYAGVVRTMAERAEPASALLVREGKVVASGSDADMRRIVGVNARAIDLRGATVMPGLIDTHPHVIHFGIANATHVDLSDATSHEQIIGRIRTRAAITPEGEWIFTTPVGEAHYFIRRSWRDLKEGKLPDRQVLDRATVKHPVMLQAWAPSIPNACALNTPALKQMGFSRETPDRVSNVWIEKDAGGEPTGILSGSVTNYYTGDAWWDEQLRKLPRPTPAQVLDGLRQAVREYSALGVTTGYEGHVMDEHLIGAYRAIRDEGALTLRVLTTIEAEHYVWATDPKLTFDQYKSNCELAQRMTDLSDDLVRVNGLTIESGGPCNPGFLRMRDPFKGPYGELTRGRVFVEKEKIEYAIEFCARTGVRLNVIAGGTAEHDEFLDMCEAVARTHPDIRRRHWILQHVFFLEEEQA
ncbi:MAG: amidohydrolase, partial [Candidatus Binataceae bacterium]